MTWAGGLSSLALIVAIGVWGYRMVMRDVSGVPVVRAMQGEMRIAPEDPGGQLADHQGLAVNNVAADRGAEKPADRLILAPRPVALTDEDQPAVALAARQGDGQGARPRTASPAPVQAPMQVDGIEELAAQLTDGVAPLTGIQPKRETVAQDATRSPDAVQTVSGGIGRSLRPRIRPASLSAPSRSASNSSATTGALPRAGAVTSGPIDAPAPLQPGIDVAADAVPSGTRLAQIGAYDSEAVARSEWDRAMGRFGDFMEGKQRVIEKANSGGRTFYRLRVMGFADLSDARRFCATLQAEKADCIPVVTR